jgi:uncharacterized lipoprotein YbaY
MSRADWSISSVWRCHPPSAVVSVDLRDTSRADAPARILATQTIPTSQGPPFAFSLTVPDTALDPRASLSVFAEIRDGMRLMFVTDTRHPVPREGVKGMEVRLYGLIRLDATDKILHDLHDSIRQ